MASKKAGKKKGGKSRKTRIPSNLTEEPFEYQMPSAALLTERAPQFIRLRICLVTWQHMNTEIRVKTTTTVQAIKDVIRERHGGTVTNIQLYKDQVHPLNLLSDQTKTLEEAGVLGILHTQSKDEPSALPEAEAILYYDFAPHRSSCPLLMSDLTMAHPKASSIPTLPSLSLSAIHAGAASTTPFAQGFSAFANQPPATPTSGTFLPDGSRGRESPASATAPNSTRAAASANTPLGRLRPLSGSPHVPSNPQPQPQPHPPLYPPHARPSNPSSSRGASGHNSARSAMSPFALRAAESVS